MSAKRYYKFDELNQYLDNEADINYYTVNQARRVAVGNMLGDFDEYGYYVIDSAVIKELIAMPKIIVDSVEDAELIRSAIKFDSFIHFMLSIEEDKAKLVLLEKINFESNVRFNRGRYSNMNEYVLGEINIPNRDIDKNVIYTKFNIMREDEGRLYDYKDLTEEELKNFQAIIGKMKYNAIVQNEMFKNEKAIEIVEADYFDNILNAFGKHAKTKEEFIKLLKAIILEKKDFIQINKPFFQKTVNEILDSTLLMFLAKLPPEVRAEIEEEIRKVKEKYFYEFNNLMHLQFVINQNAQIEMKEDSFIGDIVSKRDENTKLLKLSIDEKKLEESYMAILQEKDELTKKAEVKNADKKTITTDNPLLSEFFGEIKKETGEDLLKPEGVKQVEKNAPAEVKKDVTPVKKPISQETKKDVKEEKPVSASTQEKNVEPRKDTKKVTEEKKKNSVQQDIQSSREEKRRNNLVAQAGTTGSKRTNRHKHGSHATENERGEQKKGNEQREQASEIDDQYTSSYTQ